MDKEDARYQTLEQLHERRKQAVRLYKQGIKAMKIVSLTGLSYPTVRSTLDLYEQGGWQAIKPARRCAAGAFTPQKPIKKAYERRPEAVQTWLEKTYPSIAAKAEGGEIHWGRRNRLDEHRCPQAK